MTTHLVTSSDESMSRGTSPIIGIYKITSPSGYVYIGQSWDIKQRWRGYRKPSNLKRQPFICASIKKYGIAKHRFEILRELSAPLTQSELDRWEQFYMDVHRGLGRKLMNAKEAGSRGRLHQSTKDKLSATKRGTKMSNAAKV